MPDELDVLAAQLIERLAGLGSALIAFSGGVDSSLVAALAARALGEQALAVTAVSPALASGELDGARGVARAVGVRHELISTAELERDDYRRNDRFRCYFCKSELYEQLAVLAQRRGFAAVLSGANADDTGDWRPGLRAAAEHGVRHPLLEASLGKEQVRALARHLGVPSADKPASPCLASRLPYGTPVSAGVLSQVDRAELSLKQRGYRELRVRHFGELGRVQLGADELPRAADPDEHAAVLACVRAAGYQRAEIDERPLRSGSLNVEITRPAVPAEAPDPGMPNGGSSSARAWAAGVPLGEFAVLDIDRRQRTGVPEVVFGQSKTPEQIFALLAELRARDPQAPAFATRCPAGVLAEAGARFPGDAVHADHVAGTVAVGDLPPARGHVLVVTAGTTDLPVARECAATLAVLGVRADVLADVGVAGLGRLLSRMEVLRAAECVVVVAGMDGALPSVVAGLVSAPVIGVPTSVGYGVAAGGLAAAASMLASCSPGLAVVNIDNGFGAAAHAAKIIHAVHR